jgi:5'(3')-deoxyribonucleotidase
MVQFEEVWSHFNNFSALIKYKKNVKCHLKWIVRVEYMIDKSFYEYNLHILWIQNIW